MSSPDNSNQHDQTTQLTSEQESTKKTKQQKGWIIPLALVLLVLFRVGLSKGWFTPRPHINLDSVGAPAPEPTVPDLDSSPDALAYPEAETSNLAAKGNWVLTGSTNGDALLSRDEGAHWEILHVSPDDVRFTDAAIDDKGRWLLLSKDAVWTSVDQGASWKSQTLNLTSEPDNKGANKLKNDDQTLEDPPDHDEDGNKFKNLHLTHEGLLISHAGWLSRDLGQHWTQIKFALKDFPFDQDFSSEQSRERIMLSKEDREVSQASEDLSVTFQSAMHKEQTGSMVHSGEAQIENDLVHSSDLRHWLAIRTHTVSVSHDQGKTFKTAQLTPALVEPSSDASAPEPQAGTTNIAYASAISENGRFAVLIVGPQSDTYLPVFRGRVLHGSRNTRDFWIYTSSDGGATFTRRKDPLKVYDVGAISILDASKGEFLVSNASYEGVTLVTPESLQTYSTGGRGFKHAIYTGKHLLLAGWGVIGLEGSKLVKLTRDFPASCTPMFVVHDKEMKHILGVGNPGCVASSDDGGAHWKFADFNQAGWKRFIQDTTYWQAYLGELKIDSKGGRWVAFSPDHTFDSDNKANIWMTSKPGSDAWEETDTTPPTDALSGDNQFEAGEKALYDEQITISEKSYASVHSRCTKAPTTQAADCLIVTSNLRQIYLKQANSMAASPVPHPFVGQIYNVMRSEDGQNVIVFGQGGILTSHDAGRHYTLQHL